MGLIVENVHDGYADIKADKVAQFKGSHGMVGTELHCRVDTLDICNAFLVDHCAFVDHGDEDTVYDKAGSLVDFNRGLAEHLSDLLDFSNVRIRSICALDDLDQLHDRCGVEEVHADDGLLQAGADLRDGERRSVGCIDAVFVFNDILLQILEAVLLDVHDFKGSLYDEVGVCRDSVQTGLDLCKNSVCCVLGHLFLLDEAGKTLLDLCLSSVSEFLLDVAEIYGIDSVVLSECLSDSATHGTCTNDSYFHYFSSL